MLNLDLSKMDHDRSPILGFNHNMKHRGLVFHVQTEDSGVKTPHIFTHCFHGGVILNTRKMDYDRDADEETVKALMKSLHKAMLKQLKKGDFDEKIDTYLGSHPDLEPVAKANSAKVDSKQKLNAVHTPLPTGVVPSVSFKAPKIPKVQESNNAELTHAAKGKPLKRRSKQPSGLYSKVRKSSGTQAPTNNPLIKPAGKRAKRITASRGAAPSQHTTKKGNVVISRPSVIVNGQKKAPADKKAAANPRKTIAFGSHVDKGRKLDDVIKAYLSEQKKDK